MKKIIFYFLLFCFTLSAQTLKCSADTAFTQALKDCTSYSQTGSISHESEIYNFLITLEKTRGGKCVYKEKIYQDKGYQMLTCNFEKSQLSFMYNSMLRFSETFKTEIEKNKIFEAKMTTNGEIFQKYLSDPQYCQITHSKK